MNHAQMYAAGLKKTAHFQQKVAALLLWCQSDGMQMLQYDLVKDRDELSLCYSLIDEMLPTDVHFSMFLPTLTTQAGS